MKLVIATPTEIAVEDEVRYVRAEDASGAFGIEPGHADFLTALTVCVLRWIDHQKREHYAAVRGGVLRVRGGIVVEVATREAVRDDDLGHLIHEVLAAMTKSADAEQSARADALKLEQAAIRRIYRYLRPGDRPFEANPA
jgi:F-type H+-transporting ATPase subunit epsilon